MEIKTLPITKIDMDMNLYRGLNRSWLNGEINQKNGFIG